MAVNIHPDPNGSIASYPGIGFEGLGLLTNLPFDLAYHAAEDFTAALQQRTKAAGFMKSLLLQRICSSFASGKSTAGKLLRGDILEDDDQMPVQIEPLKVLTSVEAGHLRTIIDELSRPEARDPKLAAVTYFLTQHRTEGKTWLEHGCIVFSQYYDTAYWIASELANTLPNEPVPQSHPLLYDALLINLVTPLAKTHGSQVHKVLRQIVQGKPNAAITKFVEVTLKAISANNSAM